MVLLCLVLITKIEDRLYGKWKYNIYIYIHHSWWCTETNTWLSRLFPSIDKIDSDFLLMNWPIKHTNGHFQLNGLSLQSCRTASVKTCIIQPQLLYRQITVFRIDPHPRNSRKIFKHVISCVHHPRNHHFWTRSRPPIPVFKWQCSATGYGIIANAWAVQVNCVSQHSCHNVHWNCQMYNKLINTKELNKALVHIIALVNRYLDL